MCRFAAYLGEPLLINDVISRPKDSLIKQSSNALESDITVNGDGFGVGWYSPAVSERPALFVSVLPAWNDINLKRISHQIMSPCFFAHVRAAEDGGVSLFNCHPFNYQRYLFMHNGHVGGFDTIKLPIYNLLEHDYFLNIQGHTDSETLFALWLQHFLKTKRTLDDMVTAWRDTLATITELQKAHNVKAASYINAVVTDGEQMVGVRYSAQTDEYLSLHYAAGKAFVHTKDGFHMLPTESGKLPQSVLLSSERITQHHDEWTEVPPQHFFTSDRNKVIRMTPISDE